ncbi:hypothetical protein NDU88_002821 [Pleurodeles waltl]|uniref:Uncharacterized protein n=1 Tax=Pleurodeles waltl TaxID=8319 RepID=A0AAV7KT71_PLEWA|nr:hypothetical protein NDU88_002821 [Pleurodeles waltl]
MATQQWALPHEGLQTADSSTLASKGLTTHMPVCCTSPKPNDSSREGHPSTPSERWSAMHVQAMLSDYLPTLQRNNNGGSLAGDDEHENDRPYYETKSICAEISGFHDKVGALDHRLSSLESMVELLPDRDLQLHILHDKIVAVEDQSRRANVRFFWIPEKEEDMDIRGFLHYLLLSLLGISFLPPLEMQRAHRICSQCTLGSFGPRPVFACFL